MARFSRAGLVLWPVSALLGGLVAGAAVTAENPLGDPGLWTDDHGVAVQLAAFKGKRVALTMAYTKCEKTCPITFRVLKDLGKQLASKGQALDYVVVSLDPHTDTPEQIQVFRAKSELEGPAWHFLRGTPEDTHRLATTLGVDAFELDEHIVHHFKIWLLNPNGSVERILDWQHHDVE